MRIVSYILSFLMAFGTSSTFAHASSVCPIKVSTECNIDASEKKEDQKKGCCEKQFEGLHCQCCALVAILANDDFEPLIICLVESQDTIGKTGSILTYNSEHFHPPKFV